MRKSSYRPWLVMVGAFIMLFTCIGLGASGLTLFYQPVTQSLGFSQASFSLYYSISTLVGMCFAPVIGTVLSKHISWIRPIIIISGICTLLSFVGYSLCYELWQFYLVSAFRGIITSGISAVPATMLLNNWFAKKRGLATAIAFTGSSFGGIVYTQISRIFITGFGWRVGYTAVGVVALITILVAAAFANPSPEKCGMLPYGYDEGGEETPAKLENEGMTMSQAAKSPLFWAFMVASLLSGIVVMGVQQAMVSSLTVDYSFSSASASAVYSIFMVVMCVGKLLYGWIFDRFGAAISTIYIGLMNVLALVAFLMTGISPALAYAMALLFGLGNITATVMATNLTTAIFGTKDYGTIYGFVNMASTAGMSIGPIISSAIADATGSYRAAWVMYCVVSAVSVGIYLVTIGRHKHARIDERKDT